MCVKLHANVSYLLNQDYPSVQFTFVYTILHISTPFYTIV